MEDLLKAILEKKMANCHRAVMQKFETEDAAIEYTVKCSKLKPGDLVYIDGKKKAVFRNWREDNRASFFYYDEDKEISVMASPAGAFTFEPVAEEEMPEPATVAGTIE